MTVAGTMDIAPAIYVKTTKGRQEIDARGHGLLAKERRLLILVDARRTAHELASAAGMHDEVFPLLSRLLSGGFIQIHGAPPPPPHLAPQKKTAAPDGSTQLTPEELVSDEALAQAKRILTESTDAHLGLLGADIRRRVESAQNRAAIKACIAKWHMAMRESTSGKHSVDEQLKRLQLILVPASH